MRLSLASCFILVVITQSVQADWPAFRGSTHLGRSDVDGVPIRWTDKENVRWKVRLPGPGASSPVIHGDRVFITCFTGVKAPDLVRYVMCFDRNTGKLLWEQKRPAPQPENDYSAQRTQHGFTTATPATDGERLYVNFCRGGVFAFDLNGKEIWHRELGTYRNSFGSGPSVSLFGDLLLVNATIEKGALFALDKKTGEIVWRAKVPGDAWSTPTVVKTAKGEPEVVFNAAEGLYGFDPSTGKQLWVCETVGGYVSTTPVFQDDIIYIIGSNFEKKATQAVRAGGRGDVTKTHVLWKNTKAGASYCSPVMFGDHLFFISGQGYCLDRKTGEIVSQRRLDGVGGIYGSPTLIQDRIYLFTRNSGAYVLSADAKMTELAHNDLKDSSSFNASPAPSEGSFYIRSNEYLYCIANSKK